MSRSGCYLNGSGEFSFSVASTIFDVYRGFLDGNRVLHKGGCYLEGNESGIFVFAINGTAFVSYCGFHMGIQFL